MRDFLLESLGRIPREHGRHRDVEQPEQAEQAEHQSYVTRKAMFGFTDLDTHSEACLFREVDKYIVMHVEEQRDEMWRVEGETLFKTVRLGYGVKTQVQGRNNALCFASYL